MSRLLGFSLPVAASRVLGILSIAAGPPYLPHLRCCRQNAGHYHPRTEKNGGTSVLLYVHVCSTALLLQLTHTYNSEPALVAIFCVGAAAANAAVATVGESERLEPWFTAQNAVSRACTDLPAVPAAATTVAAAGTTTTTQAAAAATAMAAARRRRRRRRPRQGQRQRQPQRQRPHLTHAHIRAWQRGKKRKEAVEVVARSDDDDDDDVDVDGGDGGGNSTSSSLSFSLQSVWRV